MVSHVIESVHHVGKLITRLSTRERVVVLETRGASRARQRTFGSRWHRLLLNALIEELLEMASHFNRFGTGGKIALFFVFHHSSLINAPAFNLSTTAKFLVALCKAASLFDLRLACLGG